MPCLMSKADDDGDQPDGQVLVQQEFQAAATVTIEWSSAWAA